MKKIFEGEASLYRADLKLKGLHSSGCCGFKVDCRSAGVNDGDLIFVQIQSPDCTDIKTESFVYGDVEKSMMAFNRFELPRDDFSVMKQNTQELFSGHPHLLAFKMLLIRLRRGTRARGWRGKFSGYDYEHKESDWKLFWHIMSAYRQVIFTHISTRYLFSMIDTVADCSETEDRFAALSFSTMMFFERLSGTLNLIYNKSKKESPVKTHQSVIWGGMLSNHLDRDDALDVFMTRNLEVLRNSPVLLSYFQEIMLRSMNEESSLLNESVSNSEYFSSAWSHYKNLFEISKKQALASIEFSFF